MELTLFSSEWMDFCVRHRSTLSPQESDPRDICLARLVDKHDRPGECRIVFVKVVRP